MKKRFLAIAIAAGLASPFAANADATVFGKVNLSVGMVDTGTGGSDNWQVRSHASRLGFKGSEDLGNGLTAKFHIEYGINPDAASGDGISARNQFLGLKGGFGEVRVGKHDTPLKISQGKFDQFGDMDGDLANVTGGDHRVANAIAYINKFGDITLAAALVPGEGDGTSSGGDGPADTTSIAVMYKSGPLYAALALDSYDDTTGGLSSAVGYEDRTRLTATYMMGKMQFGFMYQTSGAATGGSDEDYMGLSFGMGMGKNKAKFQYQTAEVDNNGPETTALSLGYDIGLSKRTTAYVSYNDNETETGGTTTSEMNTIVVGMIHNF